MLQPEVVRPAASEQANAGGRWVVLGAASLLQAFFTLLQQGITILAPFFLAAFRLSLTQVGLLVGCFSAGLALTALPTGVVVDRIGIRRSLVLSASAISLAVVGALALQRSVVAVGACLFLAGLLGGAPNIASGKAVFGAFPARQRGMAMGLRQIAVPAGAGAAALLLPLLGRTFGWQAPLGLAALLEIAGAALFLLLLREQIGQAIATPPGGNLWRELAAIARDRNLALIAGTTLLLVMTQYVMLAYLILYLTSLRYSTIQASAALLLVQLGAVFGRWAWGWVSDRLFRGGRRPVIAIVTVCSALAIGALAASRSGESLAIIDVQAFAIGFTCISWNALTVTMIAEVAGVSRAGSAMGLNAAAAFGGGIVAPPLFGSIVDVSHSYHVGFIAMSLVTMAALVPLAQVRERSGQTSRTLVFDAAGK
ncbi:MAG: MFS transporter [Chloroflexota bacterium]|nr:MFS transporter [Chloroflexota bacterium]